MISFRVPKAALEIWRFAAPGPIRDREEFTNVFFEEKKTKSKSKNYLRAIASDGHRMIIVTWVAQPSDALPEKPIAFDAKDIGAFLRGVRATKRNWPILRLESAKHSKADNKYVLSGGGSPKALLTAVELTGPVPQWDEVVPPTDAPPASRSGFNLEYIKDFLDFLKKDKMKTPVVVIRQEKKEKDTPLLISLEGACSGQELGYAKAIIDEINDERRKNHLPKSTVTEPGHVEVTYVVMPVRI